MTPVRYRALAAMAVAVAVSGCVSAPLPANVRGGAASTAATDANAKATVLAELNEGHRSSLAAAKTACADDSPEVAIAHVESAQSIHSMMLDVTGAPRYSADLQNARLFDTLASGFAGTSPVCDYLAYKFAALSIGYYQKVIDSGAPTSNPEATLPQLYARLVVLGPVAKLNPQTTAYFEQEQRHAVEGKGLPRSEPN